MPPDSPPTPHPSSTADDLRLIADAPPQPVAESEKTAADAVRRERDQAELDQLREVNKELLEKLRAVNEELRQNTEQRKTYANRLFLVMVAWLAFVASNVLVQGFGVGIYKYGGRFRLADSVVIALITTTTATVLAVFLAVANYLFPRRSQD
jgi:hypothetical protein